MALGGPTGRMVASLTGIRQPASDVPLTGDIMLLGIIVGLLSSLVSAWLPARYAARLDPVEAIQKGGAYRAMHAPSRARLVAALATMSVAWLSLRSPTPIVFMVGYVMLVVAAILATPAACGALAWLLRPAV